jgi:hypothetical protein
MNHAAIDDADVRGTSAHGADLEEARRVTARRGFDRMSDTRLVQEVSRVLRVPRAEPTSPAGHHAALDLAARAALLPMVAPDDRSMARLRIAALAVAHERSGSPVPMPRLPALRSVRAGARALVAAIDAGALDDVDGIATWLGRHAAPSELRCLADEAVRRPAADASAPSLLFLLDRVAPRTEITPEVLRPLARELARSPSRVLAGLDPPRARGMRTGAHLNARGRALLDALDALDTVDVLGAVPATDPHPSFGTVAEAVARSDPGARLVDAAHRAPVADTARTVLRAAAWSMVAEPADVPPNAWVHALTVPQGILAVSAACRRPRSAVAAAAIHLAAARATAATLPVAAGGDPFVADPGIPVAVALQDAPDRAAAAAWHAPRSAIDGTVATLATRASVHPDARLARYTLACFDAAGWDREQLPLYLAAAASLHAWWDRAAGA